MVRDWLSTATTRYFSSKSSPLVAFINNWMPIARIGTPCFLFPTRPFFYPRGCKPRHVLTHPFFPIFYPSIYNLESLP